MEYPEIIIELLDGPPNYYTTYSTTANSLSLEDELQKFVTDRISKGVSLMHYIRVIVYVIDTYPSINLQPQLIKQIADLGAVLEIDIIRTAPKAE